LRGEVCGNIFSVGSEMACLPFILFAKEGAKPFLLMGDAAKSLRKHMHREHGVNGGFL
jgi:hypothetical protein